MSNIDKQAKYESKFSRLWERYDEASHGNAEQMRDILEVTLYALESAEMQILKLEKLADAESVGADKAAASCVEWMKRCHDAEKRIAELESLIAPHLPQPAKVSVPLAIHDDDFEKALSVLNDTLDDCGDSERGLLLAFDKAGIEVRSDACRAAMLQCSEPATDNTNQQFESLSRGDK